jgi:hypothetical protein
MGLDDPSVKSYISIFYYAMHVAGRKLLFYFFATFWNKTQVG